MKNPASGRSRAIAPQPPARGYFGTTFASLREKNYRHYWFGLIALMAAVNMQMVARAQLAWDLTDSIRMVGLAGAAFAPPILLFSLFGGVIADRVERKRVIQFGQFGISIMSLFVGFSILTETVTIWHLIGSAALQGCIWAFLMPARQAVVPQLVGRENMTNAIALNASGMSLMTLAAPGIGGVLYAFAGPDIAYFTIAGLALLAFVLTSQMPRLPAGTSNARNRMASDIADGLRYMANNRTVMFLLLLALSSTLFAMPFRSLLPAFVEQAFDRGAASVGLLMSMIGLGSLVGSLFIAGLRRGSKKGPILIGTTALSGGAIVLAAFTPSYALVVAIMVLLGIGDSGRRSLNSSLILENTDEEHRGRVMGMYMMNFGLIPLGVIPLAEVAESLGITIAFASAGTLLISAAALSGLLTRRIWRL